MISIDVNKSARFTTWGGKEQNQYAGVQERTCNLHAIIEMAILLSLLRCNVFSRVR
jgi:hypothetical protein